MVKLEPKPDAMIGIYGGTFDPVHFGHLRTILEVKETFSLDQVRLVPCAQPVHRGRPVATPEQRFIMLQKATEGLSSFVVDSREIVRDKPSYMIETLKSLRNEFPQQSLLLILGSDAFAGIENWFQWRQLFDYAHIIVMQRPGSSFEAVTLQSFLQTRLTQKMTDLAQFKHGFLYVQLGIQLDISATQIRHKISNNESIDFLLPDNIIKYIAENDLYHDNFTSL